MHTTCFPYEFPPASKWYVKVSEKRNKNVTKERLEEEGDKERIRGTIRQKKKEQRCERLLQKIHTYEEQGENRRRNQKKC